MNSEVIIRPAVADPVLYVRKWGKLDICPGFEIAMLEPLAERHFVGGRRFFVSSNEVFSVFQNLYQNLWL